MATGLPDATGGNGRRVVVLAASPEGGGALAALLDGVAATVDLLPFADWPTALVLRPASVAIVDLRGPRPAPPLVALAAHIARSDGALLVLVDRGDDAVLRRAVDEGATHVAVDPDRSGLAAAVHVACRGVARLAAARADGAAGDPAGQGERALAWLDSRTAIDAAPAGMVLVAVERFGIVNAAYGRRTGDQVLAATKGRIEDVVDAAGAAAMTARIGGGEFVVAAIGSRTDLMGLAERVAGALDRPFMVDGRPISVGVSLASEACEAGETAAMLLARLHAMLDGARPRDPEADGDDALAADLHRAIERCEIEVLFQPQVAMAPARQDAIVGVEALARWEHPRLGTLGAEPLFAAAARAGLAEVLSAHIQALALRRAAEWTGRLAALRLSINITAGDLATASFARRFLERLAASGFPAARLTVEVTESGLIAELDAAAAALGRLRAAGASVALDDFGTGYSSLAWLRALPVDTIKLDKAITRDITGSARDRAVLDGVVAIARRLGLGTVAEGVETIAQRDLLAAAGCDLYQGFLCAEPLDTAALAALVNA